MLRKRLVIALAAALLAGAFGVALALTSTDGGSTHVSIESGPSVFDLAVTTREPVRLPRAMFTPTIREAGRPSELKAWLGQTDGRVSLFVVSVGRQICLLVLKNQVRISNCAPKAELSGDDLLWLAQPHAGTMNVYGLVPNGFGRVSAGSREAPIHNNFFLLEGLSRAERSIALTGNRGRRVVHLPNASR
jgi:hypothetical protein